MTRTLLEMPSQPHRRSRGIIALVTLMLSLSAQQGAAQGASTAPADSLTTLSRVYAAAQAAKGREMYLLACVSCHSPGDHSGGKFWSELVGKTVGELFGYLRNTMPKDNAGSISDEDYTNVTAYILQLNSMPAGERPLPGDSAALAMIRVVPPDTTRKGPGQ